MRGISSRTKKILGCVLLILGERAFWKIVGIVVGLVLSKDLAKEDWTAVGNSLFEALKLLLVG